MATKTRSIVAVFVVSVLGIVASHPPAQAARDTRAGSSAAEELGGSTATSAESAPDAVVEPGMATIDDDYRRLYQNLSTAQIADRRALMDALPRITERFGGEPGFAGAQVDMDSGALVLAATQ